MAHEGNDRQQQHRQEEQHAGIISAAEPDEIHDEDEFALTDGYETASTGSTSVTSSIYAHTYENGRRYQHFKNGRYPIPNDDDELNREDMKHAMLMELCDGELFYAPIGDKVQNILDIGTGTGEWNNQSSNSSHWKPIGPLTNHHTTYQGSGRLKSATDSRTRASAALTYPRHSPRGCRPTSTS
jgi:hypothetical protein